MSEVVQAAIVGGLVAGAFVLLAIVVKHHVSKRHQRKSLALSLKSEIEAIRTRFEKVIGGPLQAVPEGDYLKQSIAIQENYFVVFDGSASMLGLLDTEEASSVISFYVDAKGLVDSLRCYDSMLHPQAGSPSPLSLTTYTSGLQKLHRNLSQEVNDVLRRLDKYGK